MRDRRKEKRKERPETVEACCLDGKCQGKCRELYKDGCPAFYLFKWEKVTRRGNKKSGRKWKKVVLKSYKIYSEERNKNEKRKSS